MPLIIKLVLLHICCRISQDEEIISCVLPQYRHCIYHSPARFKSGIYHYAFSVCYDIFAYFGVICNGLRSLWGDH